MKVVGRDVYLMDDEERRAIAALQRLGRRWPRSLKLFAAAGQLIVVPNDGRDQPWPYSYELDRIHGIPCDGGDPDGDTVGVDADVAHWQVGE